MSDAPDPTAVESFPPEELYRSLIEASPDPIVMYDLTGRLLMANPQTAAVFGAASVEELLARVPTVFHLLEPESQLRAQGNFARTLASGISQKNEYRVILGDGTRATVEINSTVVRGPDGAPRAFVSVVRDVSERKRLVEHLQAQKELAEQLATATSSEAALQLCMDAAIAHSEADSGMVGIVSEEGALQIVAAVGFREPAFQELCFPPDSPQLEILRRGQPFYGHHRTAPENARALAEAEGLRAVVILPVTLEGKPVAAFTLMSHEHDAFDDGSRRWIESVGAQVAAFLRHLTEKRSIEAQLQHAMKMEAVGRLAGGVAHDFNNLLTGILGNLSLVLLDLGPESPLRPLVADANRSAESAADLVRQLLAFSRKQIVEPRVFDLNQLLARLSRMIERLIGEDVELSVHPSATPARVKADPGQLEQILVNLAVNARDAMPEGGQLVLETASVVLDEAYCQRHLEARPGPHVMLAISDTGIGMSAPVRERLFEPFFTTKPKGRGTGLGLATTYGIVKQAGGSIEVYSEPDQGTSFKIYLPEALEDPLVPLEDRGESGELPRGSETVLVVEDDPIVLELARALLERQGYQVLVAADGAKALATSETVARIDLLITDVVMPGMNGRDLAERLRALRPGLRVLYTSGYTENVIVHHGVVDAAVNFLAKPYEQASLARKVRQVLDS